MVYEVWSYYCRRPHTIGKELTVNRLSWCIQSRVIQDQKKWTQNVEGYMWGLPKTGPMSVWMSETDPIFRWHVEKNSTHVTLRLPDLSVLITSDGSEDELFKFDGNPKKEIFVFTGLRSRHLWKFHSLWSIMIPLLYTVHYFAVTVWGVTDVRKFVRVIQTSVLWMNEF